MSASRCVTCGLMPTVGRHTSRADCIAELRATVAAHEQKHRDDHREIARLSRERDEGKER